MLMAFGAGLVVSRSINSQAVGTLLSLALFINAKQPLTLWLRSRGEARAVPRMVVGLHLAVATILLILAVGRGIVPLLPYAAVPLCYLLLLRFLGEHALVTEAAGFFLLSLASLISRFSVTGQVDTKLYIAVAVFFVAGVFKVRIQFRPELRYRLLMLGFLAIAIAIYQAVGLRLLLLAPLADNLLFALARYRVPLKTAGWLEVIKGLVFLGLLAVSYP